MISWKVRSGTNQAEPSIRRYCFGPLNAESCAPTSMPIFGARTARGPSKYVRSVMALNIAWSRHISADYIHLGKLHLHLVHNFFQMHHRYLQRSLGLFSWVFRKPIGCFLRRYRVFHALFYGYCSILVDYHPNDKRESLGVQNSSHGDQRFRAN